MSESPRDNLTVAIKSDDDWAFLELQEEETGLTIEQVIVQMVRKARKAYEKPAAHAPAPTTTFDAVCPHHGAYVGRCETCYAEAEAALRQREIAEKRARLQAELAALDGNGPTALEQWIEIDRAIVASDAVPSLPEFDERLLEVPEPDPVVLAARIPPSAQPGTLTGPVGVRRDLRGKDVIGDHKGNILRRNFGHLGAG